MKLKIVYFFSVILFSSLQLIAQQTRFESSGRKETATYAECIAFYQDLDEQYKCIHMVEMGMTDAGLPLHVVLLSADKKFDPTEWHDNNKLVMLINNGIHPGEPDGIDASMMWVRDLAERWDNEAQGALPENVCIAIIPIYNIGGCLNRSAFNRVDQNGPEEFGSRGNSQNLDLNRDFIKCDSREARSFTEIFQWLNPDVFIDNHVSDGADYSYVMTLATSQHNKLGGVMGKYLNDIFEPALFESMVNKKFPMIPYVNVWGKDARKGWSQFFDSPRYSTGYATLHNTFGFTPETHMLKPYADRVKATYQLMQSILEFCSLHSDTLKSLRRQQIAASLTSSLFPVRWKLNENKGKLIDFSGYAYQMRKSEVSELPVYFYNREAPYTEKIKFQNEYIPEVNVSSPEAYIIPQGWWKVIELLKLNGVKMYEIEHDTTLVVEAYTIKDYKSSAVPFEGHHANSQVQVEAKKMDYLFRQGDMYIPTQQDKKRFIVEVLEPQGNDSYFAWNYFDAILIQKEGYSHYAYEEHAAEYLNQHPELKSQLIAKRNADTTFANSASEQLDFVYKNSPYYEKGHNLYPVFRVSNSTFIPQAVLDYREETDGNKRDE